MLFNFDFDSTTLQTEVHVNNKKYYPVLQVDSLSYKQEFFTQFPRPFFVSQYYKQH